MGAWGPGLYQDDVTEDLKSSYVDRLHRGKTGKQVTQEILQEYGYAIEDEDDAPVFWFALADMQWNYGRLEEFVKERALFYIHEGSNLERWKEEAPKEAKKREQVLKKLEDKIMSPQPPEKKVSQYRLYRCSWKPGDVYAYLLEGEYAAKRGLAGEYLLFQKVDEGSWYPGHIIPIVRVKLTNGKQLPKDRAEIERLEYIQVDCCGDVEIECMSFGEASVAEKLRDDCGYPPIFRVGLLNTSQRAIPKKLIYIGNFPDITPPDKEFIPKNELRITACAWKKIEEDIVERYFGYNKGEYLVYAKRRKN